MGQLDGRVALVTGASRGIGAAIAERFAAEGAAVALTARTLDAHEQLAGSLRETAARIEARGGKAVAIAGDLSNENDRTRIVDECVAQLGAIEVLVNNAAACFFMPFERYSHNRLRVALEINVRAPFELAQQVLPAMRAKREGWIVNIGSHTSDPKMFPFEGPGNGTLDLVYGLSKAALDRFTTGLAAEAMPQGIAVNLVMPVAMVVTPGVEALGMDNMKGVHKEPVEAMAEAALALATCDPKTLNGKITESLPLLTKLGRQIHSLDGTTPIPT